MATEHTHEGCKVLDMGCSLVSGLWAVARSAEAYRDVRSSGSWDQLINALRYLDEAQNSKSVASKRSANVTDAREGD